MIVVPMAGESSRFSTAGYPVPKYMLDLQGAPVFDYVVASFRHYFQSERFLFITKNQTNVTEFVKHRLGRFGLSYDIQVLSERSSGQADTVYRGLELNRVPDSEPIMIFNIDTIRPQLVLPEFAEGLGDGYLEVFRGIGDSWSFVSPAEKRQGIAGEVREKERISDLCSTGLYYFRSRALFDQAYNEELNHINIEDSEFFVAPLYNHLISKNLRVTYQEVDATDVVLCGVPSDYEALRSNGQLASNLKQRLLLVD